LRPKERSLLELLLLNPGITFTRECIADFIWGAGNVDVRTVDATVSRIRQVFLQRLLPNPIRGVIGRGYQINGYGPNEHPARRLAQ
jgi:DNA-binding response OmpR family regulator